MIAVYPIQDAVFGRGDAARRSNLGDVDVGEIVLNVFADSEGDSRESDGTAEEPAYALLTRETMSFQSRKKLGTRPRKAGSTIWSMRSVSSERVLF